MEKGCFNKSIIKLGFNCGRFIEVPLSRQGTAYTCGVAALQSVLGYYCIEYRQDVLAERLKSNPQVGTNYRDIMAFADEEGLSAQFLTNMSINMLKHYIDCSVPPMLMIQAWADKRTDYCNDWNDGHYVVACGYDCNKIFFMDPCTLGNYTYMSIPDLLTRWHDQDSMGRYYCGAIIISKKESKCRFNPNEIKLLG